MLASSSLLEIKNVVTGHGPLELWIVNCEAIPVYALMEWCSVPYFKGKSVQSLGDSLLGSLSCYLMTLIYSPLTEADGGRGSVRQPPLCFMPQIKSRHVTTSRLRSHIPICRD